MNGKELQELRKKYGLTQKEIAQLLGYHTNYISRLERGDEDITERFEKLLRALLGTQRLRRHRLAKGTVSPQEWLAVKDAYHHACAYCAKTQKRLVQDHVIPLDHEGPHAVHNVVPACRSCNSKKGNRDTMKPMQPFEIERIINKSKNNR
jgi:Predicted transcriptional regulator with C-terminal CBS domains